MQCISTIGGSRFLLNLRAAYFASTRNMTSTPQGNYLGGMTVTQTEGTVGKFRSFAPSSKNGGEDGERDCGVEIGLEENEGLGTHDDDRLSSPPVIMLQPVPVNRSIQRAYSTQDSRSAGPSEPGDGEGLGVLASDLSHPAHSSRKICGQHPKAPI